MHSLKTRLVALLLAATVLAGQSDAAWQIRLESSDIGSPPAAGDVFDALVLVTDDDNAPVADHRLFVRTGIGDVVAREVYTLEDGTAGIGVIALRPGSGTATVTSSLAGRLDIAVEFTAASGPVLDLRVTAPAIGARESTRLTATLLDENRLPIAGRRIDFDSDDDASVRLSAASARTDDEGRASVELLAGNPPDDGTRVQISARFADADLSATTTVLAVREVSTRFEFIRPVADPALFVEPDSRQQVEVRWLRNGLPVKGEIGRFEADAPALLGRMDRVPTDASGVAAARIARSDPGPLRITAVSERGDSATLDLRIAPADPADDDYRSNDRDIDLTLYPGLIGVEARTGVCAGRLVAALAQEGLALERQYYRNVYEFALPANQSRDSLQYLSRRLEGLYGDLVQRAGLIARRDQDGLPMLLTNSIVLQLEADVTHYRENLRSPEPFDLSADLAVRARDRYGVASLRMAPGSSRRREWLLRDEMAFNILNIADAVGRDRNLRPVYSHPDFIVPLRERAWESSLPGTGDCVLPGTDTLLEQPLSLQPDPRYPEQWHHRNEELGGSQRDADVDTDRAWNVPNPSVAAPALIAIIDSGFSVTHPDYRDNLWTDMQGNPGINLADDPPDPSKMLDDPFKPSTHGTATAGIVGAVAFNPVGGRGMCPSCRLLLIRHAANCCKSSAAAFDAAVLHGAGVISNSWGPDGPYDSLRFAIEQAADIGGATIVFASESVKDVNGCLPPPPSNPDDVASLPAVIAVSAATDMDRRTPSGYGDCVDLLAPTRGGVNAITTTGVQASGGNVYNTMIWWFGGTSAAAPMVAGAAALLRQRDPTLDRVQIQRVLQDTADRVETGAAHYDDRSGYSAPQNAPGTHAYGRLNAFEAVRLVSQPPALASGAADEGRGGKDLLLRDHALDWGNTEQPSGMLFNSPREYREPGHSVDIRIDRPPVAATARLGEFELLDDEEPVSGQPLRVYVRVRNRGPLTVGQAQLKLHYAVVGDALPALAADFWSAFPGDPATASDWKSLPAKTLSSIVYSGPSIADCPTRTRPECLPRPGENALPVDNAQVVPFDLPPLALDADQRLALFVVVHSAEDPALGKRTPQAGNELTDVARVVGADNNATLLLR
mgnify:CR=1 FL=1